MRGQQGWECNASDFTSACPTPLPVALQESDAFQSVYESLFVTHDVDLVVSCPVELVELAGEYSSGLAGQATGIKKKAGGVHTESRCWPPPAPARSCTATCTPTSAPTPWPTTSAWRTAPWWVGAQCAGRGAGLECGTSSGSCRAGLDRSAAALALLMQAECAVSCPDA